MSDALARARVAVQKKAPYWSAALYGFAYVPVPEAPTMFVTERGVFGYNPAFVAAQSPADLAFVLAHEVVHFVLGHPRRRAGRNARLWNIAADLAVNDILYLAGWIVPEGALLPDTYGFESGLSADLYYAFLEEMEAASQQADGPEGEGSSAPGMDPGEKQDSGGEQRETRTAPKGQERPNAPEMDGDGHAPGKGDEGLQHDEPQRTGGPPPAAIGAGACGGVSGTPHDPRLERALDRALERSEGDRVRIENAVASAVREHVKSFGRGSVPGELEEWAEQRTEPAAIRWEEELERAVDESLGSIRRGGADYSLRRPSRRSALRGMIRPGLIDRTPIVALVVDTSGSMDREALTASMREVVAILRDLNLDEVWFAQADTRLAAPFRRVGIGAFAGAMKFRGRGGTSFLPALAAAATLDPPPDALVYFTDGDGDVPDHPPAFRVIWCLIPVDGSPGAPPAPWGYRVHVPPLDPLVPPS